MITVRLAGGMHSSDRLLRGDLNASYSPLVHLENTNAFSAYNGRDARILWWILGAKWSIFVQTNVERLKPDVVREYTTFFFKKYWKVGIVRNNWKDESWDKCTYSQKRVRTLDTVENQSGTGPSGFINRYAYVQYKNQSRPNCDGFEKQWISFTEFYQRRVPYNVSTPRTDWRSEV